MSIIPSLSVWSSIKIRSPGCCNRNSNEAKSSVSYVKSLNRMKQKTYFEPVREIINLRVPSPLRLRREYPDDLPVCREIHKKRVSRKILTQTIGHVTVPHIPAFDGSRNTDLGEGSTNHRHKSCLRPSSKEKVLLDFDRSKVARAKLRQMELCGDELNENLSFDEKFPVYDAVSDNGMEFNCIPTVKPWTPEELQALRKRYNLMEDKAKPATVKKKTKRKVKLIRNEPKGPKNQSRTPCSDAHKSRKSPRSNVSCNDIDSRVPQNSLPVAKWNQVGRQYHETKLAELYLIELGMNQ